MPPPFGRTALRSSCRPLKLFQSRSPCGGEVGAARGLSAFLVLFDSLLFRPRSVHQISATSGKKSLLRPRTARPRPLTNLPPPPTPPPPPPTPPPPRSLFGGTRQHGFPVKFYFPPPPQIPFPRQQVLRSPSSAPHGRSLCFVAPPIFFLNEPPV